MNKSIREIIITLIIGLPIAFFIFTKCSTGDMQYDSKIADTEANKKRFKETFGFKATDDVKNLYCFFDPLGFDVTYQYAFSCDKSTIQKIVDDLELTYAKTPDQYSLEIQHEFPWWNKTEVKKLTPYLKETDAGYYWYLWYDTIAAKAYYLEFDM